MTRRRRTVSDDARAATEHVPLPRTGDSNVISEHEVKELLLSPAFEPHGRP